MTYAGKQASFRGVALASDTLMGMGDGEEGGGGVRPPRMDEGPHQAPARSWGEGA